MRSLFRRTPQFNLRWLLLLTLLLPLVPWFFWGSQTPVDPQMQSLATSWDVATGAKVKWKAGIGGYTYGGVAVGDGKVFVGSTNGGEFIPGSGVNDALFCFDQETGKFLWQAENADPTGVDYWPFQGVRSTPHIEGKRLWYMTSDGHVRCLDTEGFRDGNNDGAFQAEPMRTRKNADIIWDFDMKSKLGVSPSNMTTSSPLIVGNRLFVVTGNGCGRVQNGPVTNPAAPSFICLHKDTGQLLWQDNSPGGNILEGQWASPAVVTVQGKPQILFPGGDGWLYSFTPEGDGAGGGKLLWKFDCNPKTAVWGFGTKWDRNYTIAKPLVYEGKVYYALGKGSQHVDDSPSFLWCIDPGGSGDVSSELVVHAGEKRTAQERRFQAADLSKGDIVKPNPNSRMVWKFESHDANGNGKIEFDEQMHCMLASVCIRDGLLIAVDFSGIVHCLDAGTGKPCWRHDLNSFNFATPIIAGNYVYVTDFDHTVSIFGFSRDPQKAMKAGKPLHRIDVGSNVFSDPAAVDNVLFLPANHTLYAIEN